MYNEFVVLATYVPEGPPKGLKIPLPCPELISLGEDREEVISE
jgi:predicted secreted protein